MNKEERSQVIKELEDDIELYLTLIQQENKELKEKLNKIEKYASELEEQYWWVHKDICEIIGDGDE